MTSEAEYLFNLADVPAGQVDFVNAVQDAVSARRLLWAIALAVIYGGPPFGEIRPGMSSPARFFRSWLGSRGLTFIVSLFVRTICFCYLCYQLGCSDKWSTLFTGYIITPQISFSRTQ